MRLRILTLIIILAGFAIGLWFYPQMPERMASHWGIKNNVNGSLPKFWGLFLMPIIILILYFLFISLPKIDPLKANIEKFRKYFDAFILTIVLFFFYVYLLTIFWNLGWRFSMGQMLAPAITVLFYVAGILIENSKRNWFIGVRTPWTLSSENVWDKTNQLAGKLFKACGVIALLGLIWPAGFFYFIFIPLVLIVVFVFVYSYREYKKDLQ